MKKIFKNISVLFLCLALCTAMILPSAANESGAGQDNEPIIDVIARTSSLPKDDAVYNKEYYDESLEGYDFSEDIVIQIYRIPMMKSSDISPEARAENSANLEMITNYAVLRETPILINTYVDDDIKLGKYEISKDATCPTYIRDIFSNDIYNTSITGTGKCEKIMIFDTTPSHECVQVYYIFENKTIVRLYDTYLSEPVEYTEEECQEHWDAFVEYIINLRKAMGLAPDEPLLGGAGFLDFIKNREMYESRVQDQLRERTIKIVIYIIAGVLVVAIVGVIIFKAAKSRKNRKLSPQRAGAGEESPTSEEDSQNE